MHQERLWQPKNALSEVRSVKEPAKCTLGVCARAGGVPPLGLSLDRVCARKLRHAWTGASAGMTVQNHPWLKKGDAPTGDLTAKKALSGGLKLSL